MSHHATSASGGRRGRRLLGALMGSVVLAAVPATTASAQLPTTTDPRFGLAPGLENAGTASLGLTHLANRPKPTGVTNTNADIAFQGNYAFVGNYDGITIYDVSNPVNPVLKTTVFCPGGQNDVSIYRNLLFVSVESTTRQGGLLVGHRRTRDAETSSAASGSSTSRTSTRRCRSAACRPAAARTRTRWCVRRTTRTTSTSTTRARRACARRRARGLRRQQPATAREPVEVEDRRDQGPAGRAAGRRDRQRAAAVRRTPRAP